MESIEIKRLKVSLTQHIQKWIEKEASSDDWDILNTHLGNHTAENMADAAFIVLEVQCDLTTYYGQQAMLKDPE